LNQEAKKENWSTPEAINHDGYQTKNGTVFPRLGSQIKMNWKTPQGSDGEGGIMEYREGSDGHYKLRDQINFPTPKSQNANSPSEHGQGGKDLQTVVNPKNVGRLNPSWVEQLMGWPVGWSQLPDDWRDTMKPHENHIDRLRMIGNGVVPATAAKAFLTLIKKILK